MRPPSLVRGGRATSSVSGLLIGRGLSLGSIGPTTKQMAISTNVEDASYRGTTFDEMENSYYEQVAALIEAGVDILLPETAIDTLNLKSCLFAISRYCDEHKIRVPVMVSGTFGDGGRTFVSGQDVEAFWNAVAHFPMLSVGMNCALGPVPMRPHIESLQQVASTWISCHPNAGLPNEMGQFDLGPADMARIVGEFAERGWVNIVGGCCGTTPDHIRAIGESIRGRAPHKKVTPRAVFAAQRLVAIHAAARQQLHDDRRADERDRLAEIRAAD